MSRARKRWWGYVKRCIREYRPVGEEAEIALAGQERREYDGVRLALEDTRCLPDGNVRTDFLRLVFFEKSHTLSGAAWQVHVSERTAQRWHGEFIRLVAFHMGLTG